MHILQCILPLEVCFQLQGQCKWLDYLLKLQYLSILMDASMDNNLFPLGIRNLFSGHPDFVACWSLEVQHFDQPWTNYYFLNEFDTSHNIPTIHDDHAHFQLDRLLHLCLRHLLKNLFVSKFLEISWLYLFDFVSLDSLPNWNYLDWLHWKLEWKHHNRFSLDNHGHRKWIRWK